MAYEEYIHVRKTPIGVHVQILHDDGTPAYEVHAGNLFEAVAKMNAHRDAALAIAERGRAYPLKNGRVTVHLFSKDVGLLKNAKDSFGGNYYRHGSGFTWMASSKRSLDLIFRAIKPLLKEKHGLTALVDLREKNRA